MSVDIERDSRIHHMPVDVDPSDPQAAVKAVVQIMNHYTHSVLYYNTVTNDHDSTLIAFDKLEDGKALAIEQAQYLDYEPDMIWMIPNPILQDAAESKKVGEYGNVFGYSPRSDTSALKFAFTGYSADDEVEQTMADLVEDPTMAGFSADEKVGLIPLPRDYVDHLAKIAIMGIMNPTEVERDATVTTMIQSALLVYGDV